MESNPPEDRASGNVREDAASPGGPRARETGETGATHETADTAAADDTAGTAEAGSYVRIPDQSPASEAPGDRPRPWKWFRVSVLLAALLIVATLAPKMRQERIVQHAQATPPPVVEPTGELKEVFDFARPATVAIETRCVDRRGGAIGVGTGFFISADGQVLSAYHVVDASNTQPPCAVEYVAVTPQRQEFVLELVGFDAYFDVALLQAEVPLEVPFLTVASREPSPGDSVVAIGNSRGDFLEGRTGLVTRLGVRAARANFADDTIELTAALAPGDSGGPVLNLRGEAIGVVSYISFNPNANGADTYLPPFLRGLNLPVDYASYAVPVTEGGSLLAALRSGERRDVPVIGLSWPSGFESAYSPRASVVDLGPRPGTIVASVAEGGPAARAGLREIEQQAVLDAQGRQIGIEVRADVIVSVDGRPVQGVPELLEAVRRRNVGDVVRLGVQRGNALFNVDLELDARRTVFGDGS